MQKKDVTSCIQIANACRGIWEDKDAFSDGMDICVDFPIYKKCLDFIPQSFNIYSYAIENSITLVGE